VANSRSSSLSELAKYGFVDLSSTVSKLESLVENVGDNGRSALASLALAGNPDQALNYLLNLSDSNKPAIKKLLGNSATANRICRLLGASEAMGDLVSRHPELLQLFEKPIEQLSSPAELREALRKSVEADLKNAFDAQSIWSAMRFSYRRELLKIAIFDLEQKDAEAGLPKVAASLADLAGAALDAALEIARAELAASSEHGVYSAEEIDQTGLSIIAMGKCGARELNYISDVDVIFVAESRAASLETDRMLEIATKLATRMMRAIDGTAREPMLWQVDANLRPEGKSGALVRTLESHVAYYERWAQSWEFQALLKARPIAGDMNLGQQYVNQLSSKVWASAAREGFVESAQKMRERVTENIAPAEVDAQIKLGPGGLRDIEFTVQLLQLVHGRSDESLRHRDTLSAISALATGGYIGRVEADSFSRHYRFLRLLEHRIQLSQMRRTHLMPSGEQARRALARSLNLKQTAEQLIDRWESVKLEVRGLHQKLFYRPLLSAVAKIDDSGLELTSSQAQDRLAAIGFADPLSALTHIKALTTGLSRRAAIQKQLLPVLLQWFTEGTDPDAALLAFRRLSEDLGESHWYLRMLRDSSGAAERMTKVLSNSRLATGLFERIPEAAAWFEDAAFLQPQQPEILQAELQAIGERQTSLEDSAASARQVRRRETLRIAMGAVLGELSIDQIQLALSQLSELYLQTILGFVLNSKEHAQELQSIDFAIVAMGRFGGEELGFGSDADIMYVYESMHDSDEAQRAAELVVSLIKKLSADNLLEFDIDIDLRPEGKNGAIVRSLASYESYYQRWADTWESQALLRARTIAGSEQLQQKFTELIDRYRYPVNLSLSAITEIRRIKARMESERLPQGADAKRHLKLGRGSLSDVEWLVQLYQLRFGSEQPQIQTPRTLYALDAMVKGSLIDQRDAQVLSAAWILASRVRSATVLWGNKKSDVLPTDRKHLEGIARILEYPAGSAAQLETDYLASTRRARAVFERLFFS
jgi:glutamate-ammonia-ligase adenylyltransferase